MLNYELRKNISATLNMTGVVISRERKRTEKSRRFFDAFHLLRMTGLDVSTSPSATLTMTGGWVVAHGDRVCVISREP